MPTPRLKAAIGQVLGCPWQRCTVHFLRDMLGARRQSAAADGRRRDPRVFCADSHDQARDQLADVVDRLARPAPKVARLLEAAEPDLLAFYAFPAEH